MLISRRAWLLASACWPQLLDARSSQHSFRYKVLSAGEAEELRVLTNVILPETETPGAEQARVVEFIDAALAGYDRDQLEIYRQGLADISERSRRISPSGSRFASLSPPQQADLVTAIEGTEFFEKLRTHTALAYFTNPQIGWKVIGRDPSMHFDPPFGFYDGQPDGRGTK